MNQQWRTVLSGVLTSFLLLVALPAAAQSAQSGSALRNAFGPQSGMNANMCRGACGGGCPDSCNESVAYACTDSAHLQRIVTYDCGTNQGCRVHDDCLDACVRKGTGVKECSQQCDADVIQNYGLESGMSWLSGGGPYDGRITFEYTREAPDALEPAFRCPTGATRECGATSGCKTAEGTWVEPVFDAYPEAGATAMSVSAFRSGPACGDSVCKQATDIPVYGEDTCPGGDCTRFGMEFDYSNADPSEPLKCSTSTNTEGESDFIGDLLKQGADAMDARSDSDPAQNAGGQGDDGMAQLMGMFGKVLASADSPEDVQISMAPLDENGNPIESQRVGSDPVDGPPPIPHTVTLPAASGHLFIPMYQLAGGENLAGVKERKVTCTHKDVPVVETHFPAEPDLIPVLVFTQADAETGTRVSPLAAAIQPMRQPEQL